MATDGETHRFIQQLRSLRRLEPTETQVAAVVEAVERAPDGVAQPTLNRRGRGRRMMVLGAAALLVIGVATGAAVTALTGGQDPLPSGALGTATDGEEVRLDGSGVFHLPELATDTRPVIEGRSVEIPLPLRLAAEDASAAFERCMVSHGARRIRSGGLTGFDDPGLEKQRLCGPELAASEAVGADPTYRVAQLAASAVRQDLWACLRAKGEMNVATAPQHTFDTCAADALARL